jgi:hypothetical protein
MLLSILSGFYVFMVVAIAMSKYTLLFSIMSHFTLVSWHCFQFVKNYKLSSKSYWLCLPFLLSPLFSFSLGVPLVDLLEIYESMRGVWKWFGITSFAAILSLGKYYTTAILTLSPPRFIHPCHLLGSSQMGLTEPFFRGVTILLEMDIAHCAVHPWCCHDSVVRWSQVGLIGRIRQLSET